MEQLTMERLKEVLSYDSVTGVFTRKSGKPVSNKVNNMGYLRVMIDRKHYLAHRLAWFYTNGRFPTFIDHIDGNRSNNMLHNLREVTSKENQCNLSLASNNTSGITGVSFSKERNKWEAKIQVDGKTVHLGRFLDKDDAILARKQGEIKYDFHSNHGKQPTDTLVSTGYKGRYT